MSNALGAAVPPAEKSGTIAIPDGVRYLFNQALRAANVLAPRRADVLRTDGKSLSLPRFSVIDEARFEALLDELFLRWRHAGWLGLAYSHLLSMCRWQSFVAA